MSSKKYNKENIWAALEAAVCALNGRSYHESDADENRRAAMDWVSDVLDKGQGIVVDENIPVAAPGTLTADESEFAATGPDATGGQDIPSEGESEPETLKPSTESDARPTTEPDDRIFDPETDVRNTEVAFVGHLRNQETNEDVFECLERTLNILKRDLNWYNGVQHNDDIMYSLGRVVNRSEAEGWRIRIRNSRMGRGLTWDELDGAMSVLLEDGDTDEVQNIMEHLSGDAAQMRINSDFNQHTHLLFGSGPRLGSTDVQDMALQMVEKLKECDRDTQTSLIMQLAGSSGGLHMIRDLVLYSLKNKMVDVDIVAQNMVQIGGETSARQIMNYILANDHMDAGEVISWCAKVTLDREDLNGIKNLPITDEQEERLKQAEKNNGAYAHFVQFFYPVLGLKYPGDSHKPTEIVYQDGTYKELRERFQ